MVFSQVGFVKKSHCTHFVDLSKASIRERQEAAEWALTRFNKDDVDIFRNRGNEHGFWFANECDALMFMLKFSHL